MSKNQKSANNNLNRSHQSLEPMTLESTMRLNEDHITNNCVIRKRIWKTYAEAAQSSSFENQSVGITSNFGES